MTSIPHLHTADDHPADSSQRKHICGFWGFTLAIRSARLSRTKAPFHRSLRTSYPTKPSLVAAPSIHRQFIAAVTSSEVLDCKNNGSRTGIISYMYEATSNEKVSVVVQAINLTHRDTGQVRPLFLTVPDIQSILLCRSEAKTFDKSRSLSTAVLHLAEGMLTYTVAYLAVLVVLPNCATAQDPIGGFSGKHTDIPRWCGKPYLPGYPNYNPGGMLHPPDPSPSDLIHVQVQPRHSIYDSSEEAADFIVSAQISRIHGQPINKPPLPYECNTPSPLGVLDFTLRIKDTNQLLLSSHIPVGSNATLFKFDISVLEARLEPYEVVLHGTSIFSGPSREYVATTELYYLPAKNTGSTVKVDNLYGGLLVANNVTSYAFQPLLPFGFYTSCSSYLNYSLANVTAYKELGFNAINPVCAFTDGDLGYLFDWLDTTNLWYQYDMRGTYLNLSSVADQVPLVKDRSSFLSWYTADEPDGAQYALNSTRLAYDYLRRADPYHPTGLVLNCANYHYAAYSSGADYIMEDAYPIGINPTFSKWHTACNATYGDCGCDDCAGTIRDVSARLDAFQSYQSWLGQPPKPLWPVLQAFSGEGYWSRDPSPAETWAMMMLGFTHGATGLMSWLFPPSASLTDAHARMARVATVAPVRNFLIGAPRHRVPAAADLPEELDIAVWRAGMQALVGVVNNANEAVQGRVRITLPGIRAVRKIVSQPWGTLEWTVDERAGELMLEDGTPGLGTSFVVVEVCGESTSNQPRF
nr:hypothetical protein CFP56_70596 [Quercus suber]